MKSTLTLIVLFAFLDSIQSQIIKENQVDEFTKKNVIRTSWEPLAKSGNIYAHVRASKINETSYLDLKFMLAGGVKIGGKIFSIKDGADIMLKLDNDSIVTLKNLKYEIACKGCGSVGLVGSDAYGVSISLPIETTQIENILPRKIVKIRIYTTEGFVEGDVKDKFGETIPKELKLIKSV